MLISPRRGSRRTRWPLATREARRRVPQSYNLGFRRRCRRYRRRRRRMLQSAILMLSSLSSSHHITSHLHPPPRRRDTAPAQSPSLPPPIPPWHQPTRAPSQNNISVINICPLLIILTSVQILARRPRRLEHSHSEACRVGTCLAAGGTWWRHHHCPTRRPGGKFVAKCKRSENKYLSEISIWVVLGSRQLDGRRRIGALPSFPNTVYRDAPGRTCAFAPTCVLNEPIPCRVSRVGTEIIAAASSLLNRSKTPAPGY
jgi:hypothetical protein